MLKAAANAIYPKGGSTDLEMVAHVDLCARDSRRAEVASWLRQWNDSSYRMSAVFALSGEFGAWGTAMGYYRLYHLRDNHIVGADELEARDDLEALRQAHERFNGSPTELWCRNRKIKTFLATDKGATG